MKTVLMATVLFFCSAQGSQYQASGGMQNYGIRGATFPIQETSLLEVIQKKLLEAEKSGKIEELQEQFQKKALEKVSNPQAVLQIIDTISPREFFFEPSYIQPNDVKDHLGNLLIAAGTKVNGLEYLSWGQPWLFINGDDPSQVEWATKQQGDLILVKGKPMDLNQKYERWFYFDQGGALTTKFGIKQVPAIITQDGLRLKIQEIKL
jgi:conjugal transfer pilus assembly protein TraW